jgi:hypothetical protein
MLDAKQGDWNKTKRISKHNILENLKLQVPEELTTLHNEHM